MNTPIAYRIETERLLLRGWNPEDAPSLCEALAQNIEHLRPWLPWVALEPEPVEEKLKKLQSWRSEFDRGIQYRFGIFDRNTSSILGSIGLHNRIGAGALEVGYWIRSDAVRQGFATEAAAAMAHIGFEVMQLKRMEIHCDPRNIASAGVPRRLSFVHARTILNQCHDPKGSPRNTSIWVMRITKFGRSEAAKFQVQAFDAFGKAMLPRAGFA